MTTPLRPPAFRAGRKPGEQALSVADLTEMQPLSFGSSPSVLLGDISEFQPDISDAKYLAWSKAIVIRAMYGDQHDDGAWYNGARRADLHAGGARWLGIYQYIVAGQDVASQARALCQLIGKMEPGEKIIADIEEGGGSQQSRWVTWANIVHGELGDDPWDYSGLFFASSAGLAPVDWVAAYGSVEPSVQHKMWQFTDAFNIPGVGSCDCSVFHGSINQLATLGWQATPTGWTFPAPGNVRVMRPTHSGYSLIWDAVTGPSGQAPSGYSVYTYDSSGRLANHQVTYGTAASEYGPTGHGLPAGTYTSNVWANGAPVAPSHGSSVPVTLTL